MKLKTKIFALLAMVVMASPVLTSCSDEPDSEHYATFTGEMMSDYLKNRSQYSQFTAIVERAGLMDLLSSYGSYTCFLPTDTAVNTYLTSQGYTSVEQLTPGQCDTIARTHLTRGIYTTFKLKGNVQNMNRRVIEVKDSLMDDETVIILNKKAKIFRELQDDSVENGVVHPIDMVLESSSSTAVDLVGQNPNLSIYSEALRLTGLYDIMLAYKDNSYEQPKYQYHYWSGAEPEEVAIAPEEKLYGFTAYMVPDDVLMKKYNIPDPANGMEASIRALWQLAKSIYDLTYPSDKDKDYTDFDHLTDTRNPLYRFMAYHVVTRKFAQYAYDEMTVRDDLGIFIDEMNPTEWYGTLLPFTLLKVEKFTATNAAKNSHATKNDIYLNRRYDKFYQIEGSHVSRTVETEYENHGVNGDYYYIDDIVAFDLQTRDVVDNCRMRFDMSSLFPELTTNGHRMQGDYTRGRVDAIINNDPDIGYNYYYPDGYLDGVSMRGTGYFVYRHPRQGYWSYSGDEMITQGNFDVSFRLPPVPVEGDYQVRLGYAAMAGVRTIAQFYWGEDPVPTKPEDTPVDMDVQMDNAALLGTAFTFEIEDANGNPQEKRYSEVREMANNGDEEALELISNDQKVLKNKGYYRGAYGCGCGHTDGVKHPQKNKTHFCDIAQTFRKVICEEHMVPGKNYYLRIRKATKIKKNRDECMLDYIEVVPKSVYGVSDGEQKEDDF
ncbi:MAG: fasciclin domain-containing protein [Prevotella sp.]|nr:fasciclin domain-containing protein [Prevotella sp.]